ncbi:MAG: radical SAM protein [Gemmatimonadales bacterium]|nr:radical SAM protein [Gemmatimonadales bacterium]
MPSALPVFGAQADIHYHAYAASGILNPPSATGMPYWSLNPYVGCAFGCAYCYARFAHRYAAERSGQAAVDAAPLPPAQAFERRILVKAGAPLLLRQALAGAAGRALARGERLVIGTATDPYQPAERRFGVTRALLEELAKAEGLQLTLITKSPLVARDAALLARIAQRSRLVVHLSLITLDRRLARVLEPRAPTPAARLRALAALRRHGVTAGVNIMPVLPGLTDRPRRLRALIAAIAAAGGTHVNAGALRLRAETQAHYLPVLEQRFPRLVARYRVAYDGRIEPGERYRAGLRAFVGRVCAEHGLRFGTVDEGGEDVPSGPLRRAVPAGLQLGLGV